MGGDNLIDPKSHNASILDIQNFLSGAGDIQIEYQKQKTIYHMIRIRWRSACRGRCAFIMGCKSMQAPSSSTLSMKVELWHMRSGINCILYIVNQQLSPFQLYHIHLIYDDNGIWCFDGSQTPDIDWVMPWIGHWLWCRVTSRSKGGKYVATGSMWMFFFFQRLDPWSGHIYWIV